MTFGRMLAHVVPLVACLAAPVSAQRVVHDPRAQTWTLSTGPVVYRLKARDGRVVLDYFGPAARENDTTRVMPSYPRITQLDLVGLAGRARLDSTSLRLTDQRVGDAAGGREVRLTMRHASLPLEVEERYVAWGETGVVTREQTLVNRGDVAIPVDLTPAWPLPGGGYTMRYLYGSWGQERQLAVETLGAGVRQFEQTTGRSSKGYVPWLSLRNELAHVEYLVELAWSGNWRMQVERTSGENDIALESRPITVRMGLRHDGGGPLLLAPGASFALPRVALTAAAGDLDDAANQMHRYQRDHVSPPAPGNRPLLVQFNTWYPFGQDVYHLTPAPDHNRPRGWMALQYVAPAGGRSVLLAYRLSGGAAEQTFHLRGLDRARSYDVTVDGGGRRTVSGAELADAGLRVALGDEWRSVVIQLDPRS